MKKYLTLIIFILSFKLTYGALPPQQNPTNPEHSITSESRSCNKIATIEGNSSYIIGCGKATTFGHQTNGKKDKSKDDGNVFCNPKNEKDKYTFRSDRSTQDNLKVKFAALRMKDISKIFGIPNSKKGLAKNRSKFCGKLLKVKDLNTGKEIVVPLMDIMSNNNKVVDLTGGASKDLGGSGAEPNFSNVQITWADSPLSNTASK